MKQTMLKRGLLSSVHHLNMSSGPWPLYLGLLFWHPSIQAKLCLPLFCKQVFLDNSLYLSSDPSNSGPYYSWRPDICRWCLNSPWPSLGPSTTIMELSLLCHYLPPLRECTGSKFVQSISQPKTYGAHWLAQ